MKTLIFYTTKTGFTKQYVDMLERRLTDVEVYPLKQISKKLLQGADIIFYGAPIRATSIRGIKKFLKHYKYIKEKDIFIFGVSPEPIDEDKRENIITANNLDEYHIRLYTLQGGFDFSKYNFFMRKAIEAGLRAEAKKQGLDEAMIKQRLSQPISFVSSSNLDRMVQVYHAIKIKRGSNEQGTNQNNS